MKKKVINIDPSKIPLNGSLGLLAFGDIAFTAWREIKKENNLKVGNEEK